MEDQKIDFKPVSSEDRVASFVCSFMTREGVSMHKGSSATALRPLEAWEIDLVTGGRSSNDNAVVYVGGDESWSDGTATVALESSEEYASDCYCGGGYGGGGYGYDPCEDFDFPPIEEYDENGDPFNVFAKLNGNERSLSAELGITNGKESFSGVFSINNLNSFSLEKLKFGTADGHSVEYRLSSGILAGTYPLSLGNGFSGSLTVGASSSGSYTFGVNISRRF